MNTNEISGKRQMEFLAEFDYIREAGTAGEEKAAKIIQETLNSFGVENHLEEFGFETFQVKKAKLTITEPYAKEYIVTGYGRCANTDENGRNASFLYVENADEISLANARGKIVMVNDPVRKELYQKLGEFRCGRLYQHCRFSAGRGRGSDAARIQFAEESAG